MALRYDCGEVITAMITPMENAGAIDYDKVESLAAHLVDTGSDAILVAGTTGESPTLTNEEEIEFLYWLLSTIALRISFHLAAVIVSPTCTLFNVTVCGSLDAS